MSLPIWQNVYWNTDMTSLPKSIWNYICTLAMGKEPSAYLLTDSYGQINEWDGDFDFIEPASIHIGNHITDIFDFMHGILPLETQSLLLPGLKIQSKRVVDAHIFQTKGGYGLIFLNSDAEDSIRTSLQEFTNTIEFENISRFSKIVSDAAEIKYLDKGKQNIKIVRIPVTVISADIKIISQNIISASKKENFDIFLPYLQILANSIFEQNGHIETLLGDRLVAIFGIYSATENPASNALSAASLIMEAFCSEWQIQQKTISSLPFRMGIASGDICVGSTLINERRLFHCHGDCIQMATQLRKCKSKGPIIIDESTYHAADQHKKYFVPVQIDPDSGLPLSFIYQWEQRNE